MQWLSSYGYRPHFHPLTGDRVGRYSVRLTANVRITFGWDGDGAGDVDIEDIPLMVDRHPSVDPVHPGEILREDVLPALSMSKTAVADALKISRQTLYDILNEKQPVTAEMAVRFGKLFGNGPNLWINLQRAYDLAIAQRAVDVSGIPTIEVHPR